MKIKTIITTLLVLCMAMATQAQIWKKITKKAEKAVERTILNKTDKEVSKKTDKTIDGVIKGDKKKGKKEPTDKEKKAAEKNAMSIFGGSLEGLPDTYEFQYVMDMTLTTKKEKMIMKYYVQPDANYFGNAMADVKTNTVIVYDMENQAMVNFIDKNGQKMAMKMRMPFDAKAQEEIAQSVKNSEDLNITPLPSKTILGYNCKGYQVKQKDGISKFYITDEALVSFVGVFNSIKQVPKSMNTASISFGENSMMMEMEYISTKRKKDNMHMICTKLEEQPFTIKKADYKSGM